MRPRYVLSCFLVSFSFVPLCLGQSPNTADQPAGAAAPPPGTLSPGTGAADGTIPKGTLGPKYVDGSFGFGFRPLAGATIDRRKRMVEMRLQLAQFVRLDVGWSLAARLWPSDRPIDVQAAREALGFDLAAQYADATVASAEATRIGAREAIRLTGTFAAEGQNWIRQQAVIRFQPKEYLLILLTTPADDREVATQTFDQILESFEVVRTEAQQQQIELGLERGVSLFQQVGSGETKIGDLAHEPIALRLTRDGVSIGVVEIREQSAKIEGKEGIRSLQQAWIFNPDQSVQFLQEEKFVAADLTYDEWRNMSQLMPSRQADPKQRLVVNLEAGIRRGDQLVVKYAGTGVDEKDKVIEVSPSYASTAWTLLLPRVAGLDQPELYAFSMYDSERRGMTLRTLRIAGPTQAVVGGRRVSGYKIEDSEGLVPPANEIIVDGQGRLLRLSSGSVEMIVAKPEELEKEFGERIRNTQKQFRENAGLPEPSAQPAPKMEKKADSGKAAPSTRTPSRPRSQR